MVENGVYLQQFAALYETDFEQWLNTIFKDRDKKQLTVILTAKKIRQKQHLKAVFLTDYLFSQYIDMKLSFLGKSDKIDPNISCFRGTKTAICYDKFFHLMSNKRWVTLN